MKRFWIHSLSAVILAATAVVTNFVVTNTVSDYPIEQHPIAWFGFFLMVGMPITLFLWNAAEAFKWGKNVFRFGRIFREKAPDGPNDEERRDRVGVAVLTQLRERLRMHLFYERKKKQVSEDGGWGKMSCEEVEKLLDSAWEAEKLFLRDRHIIQFFGWKVPDNEYEAWRWLNDEIRRLEIASLESDWSASEVKTAC